MPRKRVAPDRLSVRYNPDLSGLSVEERDALVMAPVGTPGLAELGLDHPDYANLHALGPRAQAEARERNAQFRAFLVRRDLEAAIRDLATLPHEHREMLLKTLMGGGG